MLPKMAGKMASAKFLAGVSELNMSGEMQKRLGSLECPE
jgi:hypothetical protein